MLNSNKNYFLIFLIILLFGSTWYFFPIDVSGRTIANSPELILYFLLFYLVFIKKKTIIYPKSLGIVSLILLLFGIINFIFSLKKGYDLGNTIGSFRSLVYYPLLAILTGCTFSKIKFSKDIINRSIYLFFYLMLGWSLLNFFLRINPQQEYGLITRPDGILISIVFFRHLEYYINGIKNKHNFFYIIFSLLLIFFTSSRGVYLAIFISSIVLVVFIKKKIRLLIQLRLVSIALLFFIVFSFIYSHESYRNQINKYVGDFVELYRSNYVTHGERINNVAARYYLYLEAFNIGKQHPIIGNGIGYKPNGFYLGGNFNRYFYHTAHNYYLTIWYKMGLLGIIIILLFIFKILYHIKRNSLINDHSIFLFALVCYLYGAVDVMLASTTSAILSIYFLIGTWTKKSNINNKLEQKVKVKK